MASGRPCRRFDATVPENRYGRIRWEEFLRKEVIPREDEIYAKNWETHRELMRKAGELGLLSRTG